ncbi:glycosyltransferase family 4 protein [archaeon]|jgi:glycosyltransferase involved in cell wall biosynthesis|nr:glycosyltransferase family 4 protein [archaeon]
MAKKGVSESKVYLQYPWKFPDSPYYKYLIDSPPRGIKYINAEKQKGPITNRTKFWILTRLKVNIRKWTNWLNLPIINSWETKASENYELIHCAHCLSKNKNKPWVADMESAWSMWVSGGNTKVGRQKVKKILTSTNCKKIMPWTNHTKMEILKIFPGIEDKVEIVYPALPPRTINKKKDKPFTVLFVGRDFRLKGGRIALEVFKMLKDQDPKIRTIFISRYPKGIEADYPGVEFHDLLPQKKIYSLLSESDIFLYPSMMDTFGFSILEAMSFGVPTICLETENTAAIGEIIEDDETGKIINTRCTIDSQSGKDLNITANNIFKELSYLKNNKKKLGEMGRACLREISHGKFSILERNKKLERIYMEASK